MCPLIRFRNSKGAIIRLSAGKGSDLFLEPKTRKVYKSSPQNDFPASGGNFDHDDSSRYSGLQQVQKNITIPFSCCSNIDILGRKISCARLMLGLCRNLL